jgi:hypothetical protein
MTSNRIVPGRDSSPAHALAPMKHSTGQQAARTDLRILSSSACTESFRVVETAFGNLCFTSVYCEGCSTHCSEANKAWLN